LAKGVQTLVLVPEAGDFTEELKAQRIEFRIKPTHLYTLAKPKLLLEIVKTILFLQRYKPNVIHANDIHCYKFYGRIAKWLNIPTICHMRHFVEGNNADFLIDVCPDYILYNSYYNLKKTEQGLGERPLKRVPRDVAYNFFYQEEYFKPELRTSQRKAFLLEEHDIAITVIGNINPSKGHIDFIQGIHLLSKQLPQDTLAKLKVFIVGSDVTNSGLETQCKSLVESLGLGYLIKFTGFIGNSAAVYAATDILVIPSEEEPFGRIAVEGILACKQIVAMNNSGLQEILSPLKTPVLCKSGSRNDFVQGLKKVLDEGFRPPELLDDQANVKALFSEQNQLTKLLNIYEKVLST
jgi:glycosyltransferase involved in cell wall biosynthesis